MYCVSRYIYKRFSMFRGNLFVKNAICFANMMPTCVCIVYFLYYYLF